MNLSHHISRSLILLVLGLLILMVFGTGLLGLQIAKISLIIIGVLLLSTIVNQVIEAVRFSHRLTSKVFSLKLLFVFMCLMLVVGTLSYIYVFQVIGHDSIIHPGRKVEISKAEYLLRSFICSLDLFMLDVDSNILDRLDGHPYIKGWLSSLAVLSFSCTVMMLIGLVFTRLRAYLKLNYATHITNDKNHLYLFFGYNESTELLIKDITKNDKKAIQIIIDKANINEEENDEWDSIMALLTHKPKVFTSADKIGAMVAIANQQPYEIEDISESGNNGATSSGNNDKSDEEFDILGLLGLTKIKHLIEDLKKTDAPELRIFFLSDDEEINIRNILALAKDRTIMSVAKGKIKKNHNIYCHARYSGPNRVIEDVAIKKKLTITIVDSSHLAVELLKKEQDYHPVNVVKFSDTDPTTVTSPLKSLIIGFGEVGRDAFRFLYEFGAFVSDKDENVRNPFECTIVDKDLDNIKGTFMAAMPGIFSQGNTLGNPSIKFENMDYNSSEFYTKVINSADLLGTVNYIVISIGNSDEAIALATRLFGRIRAVRDNLSDLKILVHCNEYSKIEKIQKIADHYNNGYDVVDKKRPIIRIFGQPQEIYSYNTIVSDELIESAREYNEEYCNITNDKDANWDKRREKYTMVYPLRIDDLRSLRRKESQDRANTLHALTKMTILRNALAASASDQDWDKCWDGFVSRYFIADDVADTEDKGTAKAFDDKGTAIADDNKASDKASDKASEKTLDKASEKVYRTNVVGAMGEIRYPELTDQENLIIKRLAQLEHLRWLAAHQLMGYTFNEGGSRCDERTMRHNCLCGWNLLDHQSKLASSPDWACDYKKYDYCVVDTTIALNININKSTDKNSEDKDPEAKE